MKRFAGLSVVVLLAGALTPVVALPTDAAAGNCPKAESLVPHANWSRHTLAKGVSLSEALVHDSHGTVGLHVLRVDLARPSVTVGPLMKQLAHRYPLTQLAAGHRHLIAAVNTGYFDFITGAPTGPVVESGAPIVASTRHEKVIGFAAKQRMQSGKVWLKAHVTTSHGRAAIQAVNELHPPNGISLYTHQWGTRKIYLRDSDSRRVTANGRTASLGRGRAVPSTGYLLVARGAAAQHKLASIGTGTAINVSGSVRTNARHRFVQAYGVGAVLVGKAGKAKRGFTCDSSNTKTPARTAIGYANHGHTMVIAVASDHPHTSQHGLDNTQMSKLMAQLGVRKAYDFDGSGSTELLAKLRHSSGLSLRNYPADGAERPMPLGLGIYAR